MSKRRPISKRVRFEVFKRDGFACVYCGAHPPEVVLHVDHVIAVANGGANDEDNLVTACEPCNLGKGARPIEVAPESLAEKALRIAEVEAQLAGYRAVVEARRERVESDVWVVIERLTGKQEIRQDRYRGVKLFVERLGLDGALEAVEITERCGPRTSRQKFKYFCGVCWNKIRAVDA